LIAILIKRGAGTKGAWAFGQIDRDIAALEEVYTKFYLFLREEIIKSAGKQGGEFASLSREISELIPIANAALRRLPVEQRNNIISLTDSVGLFAAIFDPRALALIGANALSRSGQFGAFLVKVGERARQRAQTSPIDRSAIGERVFGGNLPDIKSAVQRTTKVRQRP